MAQALGLIAFHALDWFWVGVFTLVMIGCGVIFYRLGKRSEAEFFLAGRRRPGHLGSRTFFTGISPQGWMKREVNEAGEADPTGSLR